VILSQVEMESRDDDLMAFEAHGAAPLPVTSDQGYVDHDGGRNWHATYGSGSPVMLLHGGLGHRGTWGYQVPMLVSGAIAPCSLMAATTATVRAIRGASRTS
jgi:pimeloyl-ACP methyl ester carboxylesterase